MLSFLPIFSKKETSDSPQPPKLESASRLHRVSFQDIFAPPEQPKIKQQISEYISQAEEDVEYNFRHVPIFQFSRKKQWIDLNPGNSYKHTKICSRFARGRLVGTNNIERTISSEVDFVGNFEGVFESGQPRKGQIYHFYFEGIISDLQLLRIEKQPQTSLNKINQELNSFKGYFKGLILDNAGSLSMIKRNSALLKDLTRNQILQYEHRHIRSRLSEKRQFFVPAFARFQIGKIRQICLEKSSAMVWGTLYLTIQMNKEISEMFRVQWQKKRKHKFHVNFNRTPPFDFPFYDPKQFQMTQQETQYQWDEIWQGIHWTIFWDEDNNRMQYQIETKYTVQLDNSHGLFFAPFNLTILKLIVTLHSININRNSIMHISVCDLHDFNQRSAEGKSQEYHPYTYFEDLQEDKTKKCQYKRYKKHIDRLTKISSPSGRDMGCYKIATNRLFLFPYHNRVLVNTNTQTSNYCWTLGVSSRTTYFRKPEVLSVKEGYLKAAEQNQLHTQVFRVQRWNYIIIEIPIYKYPVIDMIRIFVPIFVLSTISLLIFGQQNGTSNDTGFSLFAKRIASSCNILIAYVALIPLIRSKLPPSPSMTLIQIVIYLSTIPNFLAVLSVYITGDILVTNFYSTYKPYIDYLFVISFLICSISFVLMVVLVSIFISMKYVSDFTFKKYKCSTINRLCAPHYLQYMDNVQDIRKEFMIQKEVVVYEEESQCPEDGQ